MIHQQNFREEGMENLLRLKPFLSRTYTLDIHGSSLAKWCNPLVFLSLSEFKVIYYIQTRQRCGKTINDA